MYANWYLWRSLGRMVWLRLQNSTELLFCKIMQTRWTSKFSLGELWTKDTFDLGLARRIPKQRYLWFGSRWANNSRWVNSKTVIPLIWESLGEYFLPEELFKIYFLGLPTKHSLSQQLGHWSKCVFCPMRGCVCWASVLGSAHLSVKLNRMIDMFSTHD